MTEKVAVKQSDISSNEVEVAGFLDENPGEKSAMRLMSLIAVSGSVLLFLIASIASLKGNINTATTMQAATILLGTGFGGKLLQKFGEK